ncbi:MAG: hypothetical protein IPL53_22670 [Ignavibacteria bacterium]|nr:hypothetical protein [Ignavibacteria bacterium]
MAAAKSPSALNRLESSFFFDTNTGYAAGEYGTIIFTSNGGQEWQLQETGIENNLYSVHFATAMRGWCAGSGIIISTTNGGADWNTQFSDTNVYLLSVFFANQNDGWAAGRSGKIYHTSTAELTGIFSFQIRLTFSAQFISLLHWQDLLQVYSPNTGAILRTSNGGLNWISEAIPSTIITSIDFITPDIGWTISDRENFTYEDGGSWSLRSFVSLNGYEYISFGSEMSGWAAGGNMLYKTTNGGFNWISQPVWQLLGNSFIRSINFVSNETGWIFGDYGLILKTTNGGINWNSQTNGPGDLHSIQFTDNSNGWAVGGYGTLLHTTNGGANGTDKILA